MSLVRSRRSLLPAAFVALSVVLVGSGGGSQTAATGPDPVLPSDAASSSSAPAQPVAVVRANVRRGERGLPVDHRANVTAHNGTLTSVAVSSKSGHVPGKMAGDKQSREAGAFLEPGTKSTVVSSAKGTDGKDVTR